METLDRIPIWKRVSALPDEVEELKKRITALEIKLAPATGEQCPLCKEPHFKVIESTPDPQFSFAGVLRDTLKCSACGHSEFRQRRPGKI
ncbi:MAG: hypothetical protein EPN77_05890 [Candidimonas sp.]|nr:MAG: hypothetical protein EPN77_05890 [Candidimonas sp.]